MKFRIKNGYLYMYRNGKEIKEKISTQNVNLKFLLYFAFETYLRQQLHFIEFASSFGYNLDSMVTATVSGGIDVISKSVLSKIKHNKRRANIFTKVEPKYNEDIFNIRAKTCVSNSVFDIVVAFIMAKTRVRREYE